MKLILLAAILCLCVGRAAADATAEPYPPPGSPDPGPPCQRKDVPPWMGFFCKFMTVDLWKAAGRPTYTAPDGSHWQPWYYGDQADRGNNLLYEGYPYRPGREGFLEAMLKTDKLPDEYDPAYVSRYWSLFRYAPWSVYFQHKAGCGAYQVTNPYDFTARWDLTDKFPRSRLLGLGWRELAGDANDPTRALGDAAMLELMSAAELGHITTARQLERIKKRYTLREEVDAMAGGKGELRPDFARDGEVWLVNPDGTGARLDDLDTAAAYVVGTQFLMTNGNYNTWRDGFDAASLQASRTNRALVYIYFAQDLFYPVNNNRVYRRRLQYLLDKAIRMVAPGAPGFTLISMGRSAPIAVPAANNREQIMQAIVAPVPGPWGEKEYMDALRGDKGRIKVKAGDQDFAALIGGGIAYRSKPRLCLGARDSERPDKRTAAASTKH